MEKRATQKGIVLIEVVIVVAILLMVATGLIFANVVYIKTGSFTLSSTKATLLAQEGVEAVKYIRTSGWDSNIDSLTTGTTYYLAFEPSAWSATSTEEVIDGKFFRSFVLDNVDRDSDSDIASSGTLDSNTKKLTVSVSWVGMTGTTTKQIETYITNFLE